MAKVTIEVEAAVAGAVNGLGQVDQALGGLGGTTRKTGLSMTDLKAGVDLASMAFNTVKGAVESVINPTIEYGKQIRDLGAFAGISAEESSRLIQVTDDLGIEFNTLRTAAKTMAEQGLQPSVKELARMSDEFLSIQDPVQQSQYLIDNFGARAGPQMAFALRQGSAALLQMGEEAEATGLVVGEDFVESAREAELALDAWEDATLSAKVALSEHLLPAVTAVVTASAEWLGFFGESVSALADGRQSLLDYAATGFEVMLTEKTMTEATQELRGSVDDERAALEAVDPWLQNLRTKNEAAATALDTAATAAYNSNAGLGILADTLNVSLTPAMDYSLDATDRLTGSMTKYNEQLLFNIASAGLDAESALFLAEQMGLVDDQSVVMLDSMAALTEKYDLNRNGAVEAAEATAGYYGEVLQLQNKIDAMQDKTVTVTVRTMEEYIATPGINGTGGGRAHGGPGAAGQVGWVGEEGPELLFNKHDNYVMNNNDSERLLTVLEKIARGDSGGGSSGGQTVHNYYGVQADMDYGYQRAKAGAF